MRIGILSSMSALLAGTSLAFAQAPVIKDPPAKPMPTTTVPANGTTGPAAAMLEGNGQGCNGPGCIVEDGMGFTDYRFYGRAEYLLWKFNEGGLLPSLASTVSFPVPVQTVQVTINGNTGLETSRQTFNNTFTARVDSEPSAAGSPFIDNPAHNGTRWTFGMWFDRCREVAAEFSFFVLEEKTSAISAASPLTPSNFNVETGLSDSITTVTTTPGGDSSSALQTFPVVLQATFFNSVIGRAASSLWGAEANFRRNPLRVGTLSLDWLAGIRYLDFEDDISVQQNINLVLVNNARLTVPGLNNITDNLSVTSTDLIRAQSEFIGGQIGGSFDWFCGRFFANGYAKAAVGRMHQTVEISGSGSITRTTVTTPVATGIPGAPVTSTMPLGSGLLALPQDQGRHTRDRLALIPQVGINAGWMFTPNIRGYIGYDFLYTNQILRAGTQSDNSSTNTTITVFNQTNSVSVQRQAFDFQNSTFWVHGVNLGLELRY